MPTTDIYEKRFIALTLLKLGLSVSIVAKYSDIPTSFVRSLHQKLFANRSRSGPLKEVNGILKNSRLMIQGALFLKNYIVVGEDIYKEVDLNALLKAHELYVECFKQSKLDKDELWEFLTLNNAWQLCRGVISKEITLKLCPNGCTYLELKNHKIKMQCQLCYLLKIEYARLKKRNRKRKLKLA